MKELLLECKKNFLEDKITKLKTELKIYKKELNETIQEIENKQ